MTASQGTPDVTEWLTRLEETHAAATAGPWRVAVPFTKLIDTPEREDAVTAEKSVDAAAIVAAHNAIGPLIEIVREFWDEHDGRTCHDRNGLSFHGDELCPSRQMIADALAPASAALGAEMRP
ncbi:MAG: hypothetical protein JWO67_2236 [Streptosporangiaceae bacterium]|nr:hypothetical protein [Streptosporangiaceae bacterium]